MADPFEPVRLKIERGKEHVHAAYRIAKPFCEGNPYRLTGKPYGHGGVKLVIESVDPFPSEFGLAIGDAVHNLRSALDHAMFIVARPKTVREQKQVQFPIYSTWKLFRQNARKRIVNAPRGVYTVLESLQPYHRRQWPETKCLWQLRELSDWDKHRSMLTCIGEFAGHSVTTRANNDAFGIVEQEVFSRILKPGAVVTRIQTTIPGVGAKMEVQTSSSKRPVFDVGMPRKVRKLPVLDTVYGAAQFIENQVIPRLLPFA